MEADTNKKDMTTGAQLPSCPVCGNPLMMRIANGRKSGKAFIMLMCGRDGRHFRGFIGDRNYVRQVLDRIDPANQAKVEVRL